MAASILTPQQQQHTIRKRESSAVKKKLVRKALLTPYQNLWPKISSKDEIKVINVLAEILVGLNIGRLPKVSYPDDVKLWKERYAFKKKLESEHWKNTSEHRQHIVFGINAVTRALEKDQLAAVLISSDVTPPHMINFIAPLAATRGVRGTKISNLRSAMKECLHFKSCAVVGFKRSIEDPTNSFHVLYNLIYEVIPPFDNALVAAFQVSKESLEDEKEIRQEKDTKKTKVAKQKMEAETDYSHLYVYKSERKDSKTKSANKILDFLALEKDEEATPSWEEKYKKKLKKQIPYLSSNLKLIRASGKVKKRKNKKQTKKK